jgi:hypothetical protein
MRCRYFKCSGVFFTWIGLGFSFLVYYLFTFWSKNNYKKKRYQFLFDEFYIIFNLHRDVNTFSLNYIPDPY